MSIEAPYSKYCKTNFKIAIAVCIGGAILFAYDGYLSKYEWSLRHSFYEEHFKDGKPDSDMIFNQKAPFVLVPLAAILTIWFWIRKNKKIIAGENELIIDAKPAGRLAKEKIPYDSIQKIDKTYFDSRGYFIITYKNNNGVEANRMLNTRKYDNLKAVLEHLVAKIS
jgi:hypothetical protein